MNNRYLLLPLFFLLFNISYSQGTDTLFRTHHVLNANQNFINVHFFYSASFLQHNPRAGVVPNLLIESDSGIYKIDFSVNSSGLIFNLSKMLDFKSSNTLCIENDGTQTNPNIFLCKNDTIIGYSLTNFNDFWVIDTVNVNSTGTLFRGANFTHLNNDNLLDIVVSRSDSILFYYNNGTAYDIVPIHGVVNRIRAETDLGPLIFDADNDGDNDLVYYDMVGMLFLELENDTVKSTHYLIEHQNLNLNKLTHADINGDGLEDIVYDGLRNGKIELLLNKGNNQFDHSTIIANFSSADFELYDYNYDGYMDIVGSSYTKLILLKNNGLGVFSPVYIDLPVRLSNIPEIVIGSLFRSKIDEKQDIVLINHDYLEMVIIENLHDPQATSSISVEDEELLYYPNPASSILNIKMPEKIEEYEIIIQSNEGRVIFREKSNKLLYSKSIQNFQSGLYFVRINTNDESYFFSFVKGM